MSVEEAQTAVVEEVHEQPNAAIDEEIPTLEAAEIPAVARQSKRYAKSMAKMGLKPEPNITKVNINKVGSLCFAINTPEVYRFPGTNTFVIFGDAQIENIGQAAQEAAARAAVGATTGSINETAGMPGAEQGAESNYAAAPASTMEEVHEDNANEESEEADDIDAGDLEEKQINVVMKQANVSRGKAIKALKNNNGDLVNAIMELTM